MPLSDSYESFTAHLADREFFGTKLGLQRMERLMERLGHPERRFRSVHLAGTNGKGSTAAMIAAILSRAGLKTGLYTSPHLNDFCERIRIGETEIRPDEVLQFARVVHEVEEEPLTFFELATAIGFLHFASENVDIAVIETGLGGRLDATNVVQPLVSVITTIGRDHEAQLGKTLSEIAFEKAGIIKRGVPVVTGLIPPEAASVIERVAGERGTHFLQAGEVAEGTRTNLAGRHQRHNAAVALAVIDLLRQNKFLREDKFLISETAVRRGLEEVSWPGRLETVRQNPWILLDGAHNVQAMQAVRAFLEETLRGRRLKVLFGAMADKDLRGILVELTPIADAFILTAPKMRRAADPRHLAEIVTALGFPFATVTEDVEGAVPRALSNLRKDEVLLATGSLFVVGEARRWFAERS